MEYFDIQRMRCAGGDSCCTPSNPCEVNEGDCDRDADCVGSLRCGVNNCIRQSPFLACTCKNGGCGGDGDCVEGTFAFDKEDDCCYDPAG